MTTSKILLFTFTIITLISCKNNSNNILYIGKGEDVKVTLEVWNNKDIEKIDFISNGDIDVVLKEKLSQYNEISYSFNCKGEGTFSVCVYSNSDTICSEHYVESGYHVKLNCTANQINTEDHTGLSY